MSWSAPLPSGPKILLPLVVSMEKTSPTTPLGETVRRKDSCRDRPATAAGAVSWRRNFAQPVGATTVIVVVVVLVAVAVSMLVVMLVVEVDVAVEVVVRSVVLTVTGVVTVANEVKVVFIVRVVEVMAVVSVGMTNVDVNEAMATVV